MSEHEAAGDDVVDLTDADETGTDDATLVAHDDTVFLFGVRSAEGAHRVTLEACNPAARALLGPAGVGQALQDVAPTTAALVLLDHLDATVARRAALRVPIDVGLTGGRLQGMAHFEPVATAADGEPDGDGAATRVVLYVTAEPDATAGATDEMLPVVGVMRGERDIGVVFVSDVAAALLGLAAEAALGQGWLGALDPNDIEIALGALDQATRGAGSAEVDCRIVGGASPRVVRLVAVPVRGDRGTTGFIASLEDVTQRRQVERDATNFRRLADSSPIGVTLTTADGTVTYANPRMLEIIGRDEDGYVGTTASVCVHPDDLERVLQLAADAVSGTHELTARIRMLRPSGELRWVDLRSAIIFDENERPCASVGSVIDITDDVARAKETERLVVTLETTTDLVSFHDATGRAFFLNRAARDFFGLGADDPLPALTPAQFLDVDDRLLVDIGRALDEVGVWQGELEVIGPDGRRMPASIVVVTQRDADGDVDHYAAITRDISELRAIEGRLADNEAWFRSLVQHAPDLVLVVGAGAVVEYASPSCRAVLGYTPEELTGQAIDVLAPDGELERLRHALDGTRDRPGEAFPFVGRVKRRDGRVRVVEGTVVNLVDDASVGGTVINARDVTDRREADAARRRSEAALRAIVQSSPLAIFAVDRTGRVHLWNRAAEHVFGWPADDAVGGPPPFLSDESTAVFDAVRERVFAGETVIGAQTRERRRDGTPIALSLSVAPLRDASDRVVTAVAVAADISEQKRAEEALRDSEERLRLLVGGVSDVISIIDAEGNLTYASPAAERMFGYAAGAGYGRDLLRIVHPEDISRVRALWHRYAGSTEPIAPFEVRARRADGTYLDVEVIANNLVDDPAIRGIVMTTRDVSERKAAEARLRVSEAQLRESQARYRAVVDDQTELVCRYRPDTTLTFVNRAFAEFYGRRVEECTGLRLLDLYPAVERRRELDRLATFGPEQQVQTLEDWEIDAHGALHWYQWTDRAFLDDDGRVVEFQSVGRDATERRRATTLTTQQVEILERVATGVPLDETLAGIAKLFEEQFPGHLGVIWLYDASRDELRLGTSLSMGAEFAAAYADAERSTPAVDAIERREQVVVADVEAAPSSVWRTTTMGHEMRSCFSTPVLASDGQRVLGVLDVYTRRPEPPSADELQIASLVTHLAAIAIERKEFEDRLAHQSLHDPLTGLPNRALFLDRLAQAIARCRRTHSTVAVLFFDLDRFKVVNDSLGHDAGDELLDAVARRLESVVRPGDTVARFGGDEFTVLCEDLPVDDGRTRAVEIAGRLAGAINAPFTALANETFLSASIGIALGGNGDERPEELLRDADAAMNHAKELGRGRIEVFDDALRARALARHATETALHQALQRGEFRLFFQPIVDLVEGRCVGAEALVRWQHPERGLVPPTEFIGLAEENGLIVELGAWVLEEAARQSAQWQLDCEDPFVVSVNLSALQLAQPDLVDRVAAALDSTGASSGNICLEITESVLMDDADATIAAIERVRELGVRLSIDDFGTGYSSLGYLKRFPVDVVKIDRSFVDGLGSDSGDTAIVSAVIGLAHALGMRAVAEGVETPDQLAQLVALDCDQAQGYFFAPPQPADDLRQLMGRNRRWRPPGARVMTAPRPQPGTK